MHSLVVLICLTFVTLLLCVAYVRKDVDESESSTNQKKLLCMQSGITTLFMGLSVLLSFYSKRFVELIGISVMLPNVIVILSSYLVDDFIETD